MAKTLLNTLADLIYGEEEPSSGHSLDFRGTEESATLQQSREQREQQVSDMLQEALQSGAFGKALGSEMCETSEIVGSYDEGATAGFVCRMQHPLQFVVKFDDKPKLLEEATFLRQIKEMDISDRVRMAFPHVYASLSGRSTHAYMMEYIPEPSLAKSLVVANKTGDVNTCNLCNLLSLDLLFDMYNEGLRINGIKTLLPNIRFIYLDRIKDRLTKTLPEELKYLVENGGAINRNGTTVRINNPCRDLVDSIEKNWDSLSGILTPGFSTLVHGDSHPGNILINPDKRFVRFIDPKEWGYGDYLFDIAKFLHYLEVTWNIMDSTTANTNAKLQYAQSGNSWELSYELNPPTWVGSARETAEHKIQHFLTLNALNDPHWKLRLQLGMASNLLGVARSRYDKQTNADNAPSNTLELARICFAEGVIHLQGFVEICTECGYM